MKYRHGSWAETARLLPAEFFEHSRSRSNLKKKREKNGMTPVLPVVVVVTAASNVE